MTAIDGWHSLAKSRKIRCVRRDHVMQKNDKRAVRPEPRREGRGIVARAGQHTDDGLGCLTGRSLGGLAPG
jgi:hypothetical protein